MKKIILSMALLVAGITTAFAQAYTGYASIKMGTSTALIIRERADYSDAFDNGSDVAAYNAGGIVVSATIAGNTNTRWQRWASNDIEGVKIAFTPTATDVTFSFSSVTGSIYLRDTKTNTSTLLVDGGSYAFTVEAAEVGVENNSRFFLTKVAPPTAYQICYQNGVFKIDNPEAAALAVNVYPVDALTGQPKIDVAAVFTSSAAAAAHTDITPVGLAADTKYAVVVGEGATAKPTLIFRVR